MSDLLKKIYNPESFRESGHHLVDLIADHLEKSLAQQVPVNNYILPDVQLEYWRNHSLENSSIEDFYKKLIADSIHLHHPKYMGHQISPPAPIASLSAMLTDILNNGMGIYEMGGPSTAIERVVIETIAQAIGYDNTSDGFLTSGGTLANLTALLTARAQIKDRHIWTEGNGTKKLALMVSEQAHYCVDRAARIMGLGTEGIIKVPVNEKYQIRTDLLEKHYEEAVAKGIEVFAVVGSACTTSTGSYDNLEILGEFAEKHQVWFHVDGAHGGAVVFSQKYRHLVKGVEKADSIIMDCHKMMMTPSVTTALIYKSGDASYSTFSQNANYLFEKEQDQEWYNLAKRTFECTKLMMGVKFYSIISTYGTQAIEEFVTVLYDKARTFSELVNDDPEFELATDPESNIVCYRLKGKGTAAEKLNDLNSSVRKAILDEGEFYIVQTVLDNKVYFRNTMMNPFTSKEDMLQLLEKLKLLAENN